MSLDYNEVSRVASELKVYQDPLRFWQTSFADGGYFAKLTAYNDAIALAKDMQSLNVGVAEDLETLKTKLGQLHHRLETLGDLSDVDTVFDGYDFATAQAANGTIGDDDIAVTDDTRNLLMEFYREPSLKDLSKLGDVSTIATTFDSLPNLQPMKGEVLGNLAEVVELQARNESLGILERISDLGDLSSLSDLDAIMGAKVELIDKFSHLDVDKVEVITQSIIDNQSDVDSLKALGNVAGSIPESFADDAEVLTFWQTFSTTPLYSALTGASNVTNYPVLLGSEYARDKITPINKSFNRVPQIMESCVGKDIQNVRDVLDVCYYNLRDINYGAAQAVTNVSNLSMYNSSAQVGNYALSSAANKGLSANFADPRTFADMWKYAADKAGEPTAEEIKSTRKFYAATDVSPAPTGSSSYVDDNGSTSKWGVQDPPTAAGDGTIPSSAILTSLNGDYFADSKRFLSEYHLTWSSIRAHDDGGGTRFYEFHTREFLKEWMDDLPKMSSITKSMSFTEADIDYMWETPVVWEKWQTWMDNEDSEEMTLFVNRFFYLTGIIIDTRETTIHANRLTEPLDEGTWGVPTKYAPSAGARCTYKTPVNDDSGGKMIYNEETNTFWVQDPVTGEWSEVGWGNSSGEPQSDSGGSAGSGSDSVKVNAKYTIKWSNLRQWRPVYTDTDGSTVYAKNKKTCNFTSKEGFQEWLDGMISTKREFKEMSFTDNDISYMYDRGMTQWASSDRWIYDTNSINFTYFIHRFYIVTGIKIDAPVDTGSEYTTAIFDRWKLPLNIGTWYGQTEPPFTPSEGAVCKFSASGVDTGAPEQETIYNRETGKFYSKDPVTGEWSENTSFWS